MVVQEVSYNCSTSSTLPVAVVREDHQPWVEVWGELLYLGPVESSSMRVFWGRESWVARRSSCRQTKR